MTAKKAVQAGQGRLGRLGVAHWCRARTFPPPDFEHPASGPRCAGDRAHTDIFVLSPCLPLTAGAVPVAAVESAIAFHLMAPANVQSSRWEAIDLVSQQRSPRKLLRLFGRRALPERPLCNTDAPRVPDGERVSLH